MDPKQLKKLKALWEKKLKKSGFEDIEQKDGRLKAWHSHRFAVEAKKTVFEAKAEYYRKAEHFLNDAQFSSKKERRVWELHSQGVSERDIADSVGLFRSEVRDLLIPLKEKFKQYLKNSIERKEENV